MVTLRTYRRGGWEVDIRLRLPTGEYLRERRRAPVSSRAEAQQWGEQREHLVCTQFQASAATACSRPSRPTLESFGQIYLEKYVRANHQKPSTTAHKETILRVHLVPLLGSKRLDCITNLDVQRLKSAMVTRAPKSVNNVLTVLNTLLKVAVEWGVLEQMPCRIRLLKVADAGYAFWTQDQFECLVVAARALDPRALSIVLLGGEAGLRAGEIRALEWRHVNFNSGQICVERSDWRGQVTATKGNRVRYVPMTRRLAEHLNGLNLDHGLVVSDPAGKPLGSNALAWILERAARNAGLVAGRKSKDAGPHVLRHTFCSRLTMAGAPMCAIQELAGHRDLSTTQRYMHLTPQSIEQAIRLIET